MKPQVMTGRSPALYLCALFLFSFLLPLSAFGATLHGIITDESGRKLSSVRISLVGKGIETVSDEGGGFRIEGVSGGRYRLQADRDGYEPLTRNLSLGDETTLEMNLTLEDAYPELEEIVVSASHSVFQTSATQTATLDREQVEVLPHFGNDLLRVMGYLPGVVTNDLSARFSVRGSLPREVMVEFDGVELYKPYHLEDFQGPLSIVDPEVVGSMDLTTGGVTAEYGNRSAGLLDMESMVPDDTRHSMGLSLSSAWLNSAGRFNDEKASYVFSARRGYLDLVLDLVPQDDDDGEEENEPSPTYYDIYGKFGYRLNSLHEITFNVLTSSDSMEWDESDSEDDSQLMDSSYGNSYAWIRHEGALASGVAFDTVLSMGRIDQERWFYEMEYGVTSDVSDDREVDLLSVEQDWHYDFSNNQLFKWGFEFQKIKARYDYESSFESAVSIPDDRFQAASGEYEYEGTFSGEEYAVYVSDRFRIFEPLVTEIGLRWDRLTLTDEDMVSPRLNAIYDLKEKGKLHLGAGYYYQSHRPHELDVQDQETEFYEAEKAEQVSFGYENRFFDTYQFRADIYMKYIGNPRHRYENVLDPFNDENPEASPDRTRLDIDSTTAKGLEILLSQQVHPRWNWSLYYAYSSVRDKIDGVTFNRSTDQPHSFVASTTWRPSSRWDLTAVWNYHTGWPKTEVTAEVVENPDGTIEIVPVVGKFYDKRHSSYHRLDLRFSYKKPLKNSLLTFFVDIQNAYNRENVRGSFLTEDSFVLEPDGTVSVHLEDETWLGIIPSFGVKWEF
jgi:outer membrane receptor protein involved in Fe transport